MLTKLVIVSSIQKTKLSPEFQKKWMKAVGPKRFFQKHLTLKDKWKTEVFFLHQRILKRID